jgi:hypothetical protein
MNIETKFNLGDKVWFVKHENILEMTIWKINIQNKRNTLIEIIYTGNACTGGTFVENESQVYKTKEECTTDWFERQGF